MAQGYYEKIYKDLKKKRLSKVSASKSAKMAKTIANKKSVLKAGGVNVDKLTDKRNPLEKLFNVSQDQNALFDIMEVISRPQQAMFGAIDAAVKGEDKSDAAWAGLKGDKYTSGADLIQHLGVGDSGAKWGWDDSLGLLAEVALDPMDLALIPVTGGASIAADAARLGAKAAKGADAAKALKMVAPTDLIFKGLGKGIKGTAGLADKGISKSLKYLDEVKGIRNSSDELMKLTYKTPDAKRASEIGKSVKSSSKWDDATRSWKEIDTYKGSKPKGRFEAYKEIKESFKKKFNATAAIPKKALDAFRKTDAEQTRVVGELNALREVISKKTDDVAHSVAQRVPGTDAKTLAKQIDDDLFKIMDRPEDFAPMEQILVDAKNKHIKFNQEVADKLTDLADDINKAGKGINLSFKVDADGMIELSDEWDMVMKVSGIGKAKKGFTKAQQAIIDNLNSLGIDPTSLKLDNTKLSQTVKIPSQLDPAELKELEDLVKKYETDPELKKLYDETKPIFDEANKVMDEHFGLGMEARYANNEGYARHVLDTAVVKKYNDFGILNLDGTFKAKGSTKALSKRKWNMSAQEANKMFYQDITKNMANYTPEAQEFIKKHDKLFKTSLTGSFDGYIEAIPKLGRDNRILDEILVKQTFGDFKEMKKVGKELSDAKKAGDTALVEKLSKQYSEMKGNVNMKILTKADSEVPSGFRVLKRDEAKNLGYKMEQISEQLGLHNMDQMSKLLKNNAGVVAFNEDIIRLIEVSGKKEVKGFTRMYDTYLNNFKKLKVLSPTFQLNNLIFNTTNMMLAGINPARQAALYPEAIRVFNSSKELMQKAARAKFDTAVKLTPKENEMLKVWNGFVDAGFGDVTKALEFRDMPESLQAYFNGTKKFRTTKDFLVDGLPYINNYMNQSMDTVSRLVMFMEGSRNPKFLQKLGVADAGDAVRKALFDPSDLSTFEKDVMKRMVPFYTFTKKNLVFQANNLANQGSKYHRLVKGYNAATNSVTDGNYDTVADFLKDNMYIPIPSLGPNGEYRMIRAQIPFGQLMEIASNPLKSATSMLTPALKAPLEYVGNVNTFNGLPIEKFEGEKSKNIPFLTKKQEFLLSNATGADVPLKQLTRMMEGLNDPGNENIMQGIGNGALNLTTMKQSVDKDKLYKMYDDLDELETIMNQYQQKGYQFSTMNELKAANKNKKLDDIMAKLNKLNGIKKNPYSMVK